MKKNSFQANVRAADWSKLSEIRDINEYWNIIEETIEKVADTMYPLKEYTGLGAQIQKTRQFLVISLFHQVYRSCIQRLPVILTFFGGYFK